MIAANLVILLGTRHAAWLSAFLIGSSFLMSLALMVHAICPFLVFQLPWKYLLSLLYLPLYAVWKLPAMFSGRPTQWVRTARESPSNPEPVLAALRLDGPPRPPEPVVATSSRRASTPILGS